MFEQIEGLVSSKLSIVKTIISIIKLETRLAGKSVYSLLINVCLLLIVFITIWLSAMLILGYCVTLVFHHVIIALACVLLLNLGLLLLLLKYLSFNLKNMSFEKTRHFFSEKESNEYDKLEEKSHH